jgi:hypothetical protein
VTVQLKPTSRTVCIETDDELVERYVHTAYANVLADAPTTITHTAALLTAPGASHVAFDGVAIPRDAEATGTPWDSDTFVVDQFVWRALANDPDWMALYAGAVVIDGRAVLLVGDSGVGKTTLALALRCLGAGILGDEMALVHRRDHTVDAIDRRLSIRRDGGGAALVDRRVLGTSPAPAPLAATFIITRGTGAPQVAPVSAARTALTLASYLGARPKMLADVTAFARVLERGRCFALTLGDPSRSARTLLEVVRGC